MLRLYSIWFLIYIIPKCIFNGVSISYIKSYLMGYSHLWYLLALAFGMFFIGRLMNKKINLRILFILSLLLYIIGLAGETYFGLFFDNKNAFYIFSSRNGLFFAPIYLVVGIIFAYKGIKIKTSISVIFSVLFAILWAFEVIILKKADIAREYNMSLFMLPTTFFVFNFLINYKINIRFSTKLLRKVSSNIYFVHMFCYIYIIPIIIKIIEILIRKEITFNSLEKYIIVILLSIATSLLIIKLQKLRGFGWLKYLS